MKAIGIATLLSCAVWLAPAESAACGGCFSPPSAVGAVTGHRMAFAVSDERTVLWDQFEYSGSPEDFSWVLPVLPGAYLEASTDAWFETLETVTQTTVTGPSLTCAQTDSGCAGSVLRSSANSDSGGFYAGGGVMVLHRATVGPYKTVTLRSTDGDALTHWLTDNGYAIPPDIQPVIDAYVSEGTDFVAVRLSPGKGVQQMTPVRVVTPGGEYLLPLRMVAAGIGESVEIVLYVIGDQRYAMPDLHEVSLDTQALVWNFADSASNYLELRRQALAKNLGFSYLPTFSFEQAFVREYTGRQFGGPVSWSLDDGTFQRYTTFASLYFAGALSNDDKSVASCPGIAEALDTEALVAEPDAEGNVPDGSVPASDFTCEGYSDLSAAMIGMRPRSTWLTRLELDLPKEALSMDCAVVPAMSQDEVSNQLLATKHKGRPSGCDEVVFESRIARGGSGRAGMLLLLSALSALLVLRRRRSH